MARYQREIEEILDKVNEDLPADAGSKRGQRSQQETRSAPRKAEGRNSRVRFDFSPGRLVVIGAALLVAALLFVLVLPAFAQPTLWIGVGLFIVAYLLFFTKPRRTMEKRWRGQSIEDEPELGPLQRFWRWVTRG